MTSNPSPIQGTAAVQSFYHKAASYAVWVLPACIVVNFMLSGLASSIPSRSLKLVLSAIPALLMISAIPAGIIALFGIRKFGKKKLLWKGLVGVLVPILLIAMAVPAFLMVKRMSEARARQAQQSR